MENFELKQGRTCMRIPVKVLIPSCFITLVALSSLMGSWYTVNQGERGIKLRFGKVVGVAEPGLGFKMPFIEGVEKISIRNHSAKYDQLHAYSKDQQPAALEVSVNYHVQSGNVENIYNNYGNIEKLVARTLDRSVPTQVENIFGQYTAVSVVQKRKEFVSDLQKSLTQNTSQDIVIDSVQVENIDFSDDYEASIGARMKAEVAVATQSQNLESEKIQAEIAVTKANAIAQSQLAIAKTNAEATRLKGAAEAASIRQRGAALQNNPQIVSLTTAERWDGKLPQTMLPGATVPFINAK